MIYVLLFMIGVILVASIVPIIQFIYFKTNRKLETSYYFSKELLDYDMDDLTFEKAVNDSELISRGSLANRGWVRCLNGTILTKKTFEEKRKAEYEIPLP